MAATEVLVDLAVTAEMAWAIAMVASMGIQVPKVPRGTSPVRVSRVPTVTSWQRMSICNL